VEGIIEYEEDGAEEYIRKRMEEQLAEIKATQPELYELLEAEKNR